VHQPCEGGFQVAKNVMAEQSKMCVNVTLHWVFQLMRLIGISERQKLFCVAHDFITGEKDGNFCHVQFIVVVPVTWDD
jgi:hypothetical protein